MDKMKLKLPNFLIVGAAKSGTTSLYYYLKQHPEIYMSDFKEPQFFSFYGIQKRIFLKNIFPNLENKFIRDWKSYLLLFQNNNDFKVIGEASTSYLFNYQRVIKNLNEYLPMWKKLKIVIIIRNPIDACFSHYSMYRMRGDEPLVFEKALEAEKERVSKKYITLAHSIRFFFYHQVKAYLDNFDHVKIYLYDDLKKDALGLTKDMYGFLGVDPSFVPDISIRFNVSGIPKNKFIHKFLKEPNILKSVVKPIIKTLVPKEERRKIIEKIKMKNLQKPQMKPETHEYLKNLYREDILKLQDLIKRDLSSWLE